MTKKFKVGDRVRCISNGMWHENIAGKFGTVVAVNYDIYSIEFDEYISGHDCHGVAKNGYGWNCTDNMLIRVKDEVIVIYRKGRKVVALDKRTGKKGVAKCCPGDVFDFETGAKLAFDRLIGADRITYNDDQKKATNVDLKTMLDDLVTLFALAEKYGGNND